MFRKLLNSELNRITPEEFKLRKKVPVTVILGNIRSQHNIGSAFRSYGIFLIKNFAVWYLAVPPSAKSINLLGAEFSVDRILRSTDGASSKERKCM